MQPDYLKTGSFFNLKTQALWEVRVVLYVVDSSLNLKMRMKRIRRLSRVPQ